MRRAPALLLLFLLGGCDKLKRSKPVDAGDDGAAAAASAASAAAQQAAAIASAKAAASAAEANLAYSQHVTVLRDDLKWFVAHNVTVNPNKTGEGDASSKCDEVKTLGGKPADPDVKLAIQECVELCAFDIPIVTAVEALDHLKHPTSQASKRLMCDVATRELDRAKPVKPKDPKLKRVTARRIEACGR